MPLMDTMSALAMLKRDREAAHLVGMPWEHAQAFMKVARQEKCVISSRQLGRVCTGLMRGGYDTKGFRMKSKSCDFGPMAGFICVDERLHKKGAAYNATQKKDIEHSMHGDAWDKTGKWKAGQEQICLTQERFNELRNWGEGTAAKLNGVMATPDIFVGKVTAPVELFYMLKRETRFGEYVWALYSATKALPQNQVTWKASWDVIANDHGIKPMLALVNPYPAYPVGHYKNCCTGDYDLFGVWPKKSNYQAQGEDRRIAGMNPDNKAVNKQTVEWEDKRLGNISNRVHTVAQMINSTVHSFNGGVGAARDVIHHSDEAGRPFISGIDDHVIAFIPAPGADFIVGLESPNGIPVPLQWSGFFRAVNDLGFQVILNTHWKAQMGAWGVGGIGTTGDAQGWRTPQNSPVRST